MTEPKPKKHRVSNKGCRPKGGRYEREVAAKLRALWPNAERGLGQARRAGEAPDVKNTPYWIECKRGNSTSPRKAWKQAERGAADNMVKDKLPAPLPPMVVYRDDHDHSVVMMRLDDLIALVLDAKDWL